MSQKRPRASEPSAQELRRQAAATPSAQDRQDRCLPPQPARLCTSEELRIAGGVEAYAARVRHWFFHERNDAEVQREVRTGILLAIVRTLCLATDHEWASAVPQGLVRAAGHAAGRHVNRPRVRGDAESLARLRELLKRALTASLSVEERDVACDTLWLPEAAPPPAASASADATDACAGCGGETPAEEEASLTLKEVMGPLVQEVSTACDAPRARAAAAERLVREFGPGVDAAALLPLRCTLLHAFVEAADVDSARRWANEVHRDWMPPPLQAEYDRLLTSSSGGVGSDAGGSGGCGVSSAAAAGGISGGGGCEDGGEEGGGEGGGVGGGMPRGGGGLEALPAPLLEAGQLAVAGWGTSSFGRGRGRHGAVVLGARGTDALGRGCNAAECPAKGSGKRAGKRGGASSDSGGVHGKFVVHAEMAAVRQALEASGGDLGVLRGACVYVARLSARSEHYEDAAPCEPCARVLRACGVGRAFFTTSRGTVDELELAVEPVAEGCCLSDAHCKWMGVPSGWARVHAVEDAEGHG
jgi:deoxycytidylate deaminase